jgi:hypothetical protein
MAIKKTCAPYRWAELRVVGRNHAELDDWLRDTRPFAADRAAGQRWVEANADDTRRHVEMGARKIAERAERSKASPTVPTSGPSPAPAPSSPSP